jgi:hypothetical protein
MLVFLLYLMKVINPPVGAAVWPPANGNKYKVKWWLNFIDRIMSNHIHLVWRNSPKKFNK